MFAIFIWRPGVTGRLIDVDGCRLSIRTTGSGAPPVVMISSSGGAHDQWDALTERLGDSTCITYGRPGLGASDPLPPAEARTPRGAAWAAAQLRTLLQGAGGDPPYVVVGCSIGGYIADQFAARWPQETAGIVQIDPTWITQIPRLTRLDSVDDADGAGIFFSRDLWHAELTTEPAPQPARAVVISRAYGTVPAEVVERAWRPLTVAEADDGWRECQREWVRRLDAVHVAADNAGHHVQIDEPGLVALVVDAVVTAARENRPVALDGDDIAAAAGQLLD